MCDLSHIAHFFLLSLVQLCLPGGTQATSGALGVRDTRKCSFRSPASTVQVGTPERGCDGCLPPLHYSVFGADDVWSTEIYSVFMKKKYFPIHGRLKCFGFI